MIARKEITVHHRMRRILAVAVCLTLVAVVLLVGACVSKPATTVTQPATTVTQPVQEASWMVFGSLQTLSGGAAPWGIAGDRGSRFAADDINEAGGFKVGGKIYKIKVVTYDNQYTGTAAIAGATRMINEDGAKVITNHGTGPSLAAYTVTEPNKVIQFVIGGASELVSPKTPYGFRINPGDDTRADALYKYIAEKRPEIKTVVGLAPNDDSGKAISKFVKGSAQKSGVQVLAQEYYERGTTDFYPLLTRIMVQNPNAVDLDGMPDGDRGVLKKQAAELGYKGWFISTGAETSGVVAKVAGDAAWKFPSIVSSIMLLPDAQQNALGYYQLSMRYKSRYNEEPPLHVALGYDAVSMYVQAVQKAGSFDPDKVKQALETATFKSVFGEARFGQADIYGIGHQLLLTSFVYELDPATKNWTIVKTVNP